VEIKIYNLPNREFRKPDIQEQPEQHLLLAFGEAAVKTCTANHESSFDASFRNFMMAG
jgi:hypothetical protein